jgi:chromosome segregation ATPase
MAKSKSPTATATVPRSQVADLAQRQRELLDAAEQILFDECDGQPFKESDAALIFSAVGWDQRRIERERGRCRAVRESQAAAGTERERADCAERLAALTESVPRDIEQIDAEIAALQVRRGQLAAGLAAVEQENHTRTAALERLRDFAPRHIRDEYNAACVRLNESALARDAREAASRLETVLDVLERLAEPEPKDGPAILAHCKAAAPELVVVSDSGPVTNEFVPKQDWADYIDRLQRELPALEKRAEKLAGDVADAEAELARALDCYIK